MTTITTEKFSDFWIEKIIKENEDHQYDKDWFFDFRFGTIDLPFDWNEENFLNYFKKGFSFPLKRINLDFVEGKYICVGKVEVECKIEPFDFFTQHTH